MKRLRYIFSTLFLVLFTQHLLSTEYEFQGKHFIASYYDCDEQAINDVTALSNAFHDAAKASGATILNSVGHVFEPTGLTLVILLSESHASIHTYPEKKSCFVDLFTCGSKCRSEEFDQVLRNYLKPGHVSVQIIERGDTINTGELPLCSLKIAQTQENSSP